MIASPSAQLAGKRAGRAALAGVAGLGVVALTAIVAWTDAPLWPLPVLALGGVVALALVAYRIALRSASARMDGMRASEAEAPPPPPDVDQEDLPRPPSERFGHVVERLSVVVPLIVLSGVVAMLSLVGVLVPSLTASGPMPVRATSVTPVVIALVGTEVGWLVPVPFLFATRIGLGEALLQADRGQRWLTKAALLVVAVQVAFSSVVCVVDLPIIESIVLVLGGILVLVFFLFSPLAGSMVGVVLALVVWGSHLIEDRSVDFVLGLGRALGGSLASIGLVYLACNAAAQQVARERTGRVWPAPIRA